MFVRNKKYIRKDLITKNAGFLRKAGFVAPNVRKGVLLVLNSGMPSDACCEGVVTIITDKIFATTRICFYNKKESGGPQVSYS